MPDVIEEIAFDLQKARDYRFAEDIKNGLVINAKPIKSNLPFAQEFCRERLYYNPNAGNKDIQNWTSLEEVLNKALYPFGVQDSVLLKYQQLVNNNTIERNLAATLFKNDCLFLNSKNTDFYIDSISNQK